MPNVEEEEDEES